jgi:hypothetical protein
MDPQSKQRLYNARAWGSFGEDIDWSDELLREAWEVLGDVPVEEVATYGLVLDEDFMFRGRLVAPKNTDQHDLWHWFDEMHSEGLAVLMGLEEARSREEQPLLLSRILQKAASLVDGNPRILLTREESIRLRHMAERFEIAEERPNTTWVIPAQTEQDPGRCYTLKLYEKRP